MDVPVVGDPKLDELHGLLRELQEYMRLADWRITLHWARPRQLKSDDYASVYWWAAEQRSEITLRSEESIRRSKLRPCEFGHTLTHELVHVKLEGHENMTKRNDSEAGVDHIAEIIWKAFLRDRKEKKDEPDTARVAT
jgi:hypothetical protein